MKIEKLLAAMMVATAWMACGADGAKLKVAVYAGAGPSGIGALEWYRLVESSPEMELKLVDGASVASGALEGQDMLVMPGGASKGEYRSLGTNGVARMKDFIRAGGAYLGTCAGCCLLMDGKDRARVFPWNSCGSEGATLFPTYELNADGAKALGLPKGKFKMRYHGGPLMWPTTNVIAGADFKSWGTIQASACMSGPVKRKMLGAVGLVGGTYGKGRVFATSGHPEYFESTHYIVIAAIRWLTGRTVTFTRRPRQRGDLTVGVVASGFPVGISNVTALLSITRMPGVDYHAIDPDGIWQDDLNYLDAVVLPATGPVTNKVTAVALQKFHDRGGRVYGVGKSVRAHAPSYYENVDTLEDLLPKLK